MRPLSELYKVVLNSLKTRIDYHHGGICIITLKSGLTNEEEQLVYRHFNDNKPSRHLHKQFFDNPLFKDMRYWWTVTREGHQQRLLFLEHLIKQCKENESRTKTT